LELNGAPAPTGLPDVSRSPSLWTTQQRCWSMQKPSVLIVDDAPDNLRLLAQLLEGEDYEVRIAPGGRFALESVRIALPDLILLDIQMPDVGGFEVCRMLKSDEATKHIPIIFLTALASVENEGKGLELGAVDYISKPFNAHIVRIRVRNHLQYIHQRKLLEQLAHIDPLTEISNRR
jgi:PleD family two-component response regulator